MRCADCRPLLSKYVDGEALPLERAEVEAHIGACKACSRLLVQYTLARSRVSSLPDYRPDPRMRARLFSSIERETAPPPETISPRQPAPAGLRPVRYPLRRFAGSLFGNLATAAAVLLVLAAGLLIWQITGGPPAPVALATGTPPGLPVPTQIVAIGDNSAVIPAAQPTALTTLTALGGGGRFASPTAPVSQPAEDPVTIHSVRDETYGYQFQYPAGWWTASSLPVAGLLAHRLLRPWSKSDSAVPDYAITLDVIANPDQVSPNAALKDAALLKTWKVDGVPSRAQAVNYDGLAGFTLPGADSSGQATYLFAGTLVYRIALLVRISPRPSAANPKPTPGELPGTAIVDQVLRSFHAAPDAASRSATGYVPVFCVHGGEVWSADPAGGAPQQVTHTGGIVQSYALSPDLNHLALILGATGGQSLVVQALDTATVGAVLWTVNEISAVAWDGDQALIVIGGAPGAQLPDGTPYGLYRQSLDGTRQSLADWSAQADLVHSARNLAVTPDRRQISFLATGANGPDLYALRADGTGFGSVLGTGTPIAVTQYAWLPPSDTDTAPRLLLAAGPQLDELALPAPGTEPQLKPVTEVSGMTFGDVVVAASGEVAAVALAAGASKIYMAQDQAPSTMHMFDLPSAPVPGSLALAASGHAVFYRQALAPGGERLLMLDASGGAPHPLGDLAP